MAAAQTKGHEENKLTGMQGKSKKRKNRKRKVGSKAQKASKKVVLKAYPQQQIFYLLYSGT